MSNGSYQFVNVTDFTPNQGQWTSLGNWTNFTQNGNSFVLQMNPGPIISFLSATVVRVRFNPTANYSTDNSYAVVNQNLGAVNLTVTNGTTALEIDTGVIRVLINKSPYALSVFRGSQLIHSDITTDSAGLPPYYNLVYIPGQEVIANFKSYPANALYFGFGEKAGNTLKKNQFTMTFFNFDNFSYSQGPLPSNVQLDTPFPVTEQGPFNPAEPLYCSVPLLIETNPNPTNGTRYNYGIFFDNPSQTYFNIGVDAFSNMFGKYYFGALYGDLNYYFIYGNEVPQVTQQYLQLTGFPPLPPKYALGYHQGCYGFYTENLLLEAANNYRTALIPIDGLHIDVDFQDNYRTFTSSPEKFPNPQAMFDSLHSRGFKCSTNITPLVTNNTLDETGNPAPYSTLTTGQALNPPAFLTYPGAPGVPPEFVGVVDYGPNGPVSSSNPVNPFSSPGNPLAASDELGAEGFYPDLGRPDVQVWWGQQYANLISLGLDMIWQDETCPGLGPETSPLRTLPLDLLMTSFGNAVQNARVHNAYVLTLLQATYEGLNQLRPGTRNFIIARGGYAGMQRYAALWTGDSASSWEFLQINVPMVLNLGLSGIPLSGCDIGGFATSGEIPNGTTSQPFVQNGKVIGGITNPELLTRWILVGSFLPWFRNHYDGYSKQFQEPYAYSPPVPQNCGYFIDLRYRMLPLYYSLMFENTQTGMPIARALFLNDPSDMEVYNHLDDQFFVGNDFLVAPILTQSETASPPLPAQRNVYLPAGSNWYAFMDNNFPLAAPVAGGTTVFNFNAPLSNPPQFLTPIYIRAGAILPMQESEQWVGQLPSNPLTFNIYPGPDSSFNLYLDDGISTAVGNRQTTISHSGTPTAQQVRVLRVVDTYTPPEGFYFVSLLGQSNPPSSVIAAGVALMDVGSPSTLAASPVNAYYHNTSINQTFIKILDNAPNITIQVTYPG